MLAMVFLGLTINAITADPVVNVPLLHSVGLPAIHDRRLLTIDATVPIVVTNTSPKPVRIWRDTCSWGYANLSLELKDSDAKADDPGRLLVKLRRDWLRNAPDAAELAPGESLVFMIKLSDDVWKDFDFFKSRVGKKVRMRVRYHNVEEARALEHKVWTGSLHTAYQDYVVGKP